MTLRVLEWGSWWEMAPHHLLRTKVLGSLVLNNRWYCCSFLPSGEQPYSWSSLYHFGQILPLLAGYTRVSNCNSFSCFDPRSDECLCDEPKELKGVTCWIRYNQSPMMNKTFDSIVAILRDKDINRGRCLKIVSAEVFWNWILKHSSRSGIDFQRCRSDYLSMYQALKQA